MMAEAAVKIEQDFGPVRRFQLADLNQHGGWILSRLKKVYPHLTDQVIFGWLRGLIYTNEFLFLQSDHGIALFQLDKAHTLSPRPVVREQFVLAQEGYQEEAGIFYEEAERWAISLGADTILVEVISDVPPAEIKKRLKRVFERPQKYAKVG